MPSPQLFNQSTMAAARAGRVVVAADTVVSRGGGVGGGEGACRGVLLPLDGGALVGRDGLLLRFALHFSSLIVFM